MVQDRIPSLIRRGLKRSASVLVACSLGMTAASAAFADAAAQARYHDARARKAYEKRDWDGALREFFLEHRLAPNPRIAFNIALCFEQLSRGDEAFQFFTEYLAGDDPDADRHKYATDAVAKLEPAVARLSVTSVPPGARIFVDKREHGDFGATPRVIAVRPGDHKVWVELPGHRPAEAAVRAEKGAVRAVALAPALIVGTLRVTSPAAGHVEVRSPDQRLVASGRAPLDAQLPPGPYELLVRADKHLPWRGLAAVRADGSVEVAAAPEPVPPPTGDFTITSNVSGALIELDGRPAGFSPAVLSSVPVGSHRLRVAGQGVLPWQGAVQVRADERAWVTVTLQDPPVTTRSPATWVVGGIGIGALAGAGLLGVLAGRTHSDYGSASPDTDRGSIADRGLTYNQGADILLVSGLVSLGAATWLYFATERQVGQPSGASVARGPR